MATVTGIIDKLKDRLSRIKSALSRKGVTAPSNMRVSDVPSLIKQIDVGMPKAVIVVERENPDTKEGTPNNEVYYIMNKNFGSEHKRPDEYRKRSVVWRDIPVDGSTTKIRRVQDTPYEFYNVVFNKPGFTHIVWEKQKETLNKSGKESEDN